jgi:lipopolysaccharide/colanic/teichoic acid biosynthesis glycosyltransferase
VSEQLARMRMINVPTTGLGYRLLKRSLDLAIASTVLLLLSPLMALIAILLKATSRGPAIFRQERVGLNGQIFICYKFRSMVADADSHAHKEYITAFANGLLPQDNSESKSQELAYKLTNDSRVTPFGKFLRRSSLDELPQLANVLRGQMSIVGPRPDVQYSVDLYKDWHYIRLQVKPGITGLWQVKGRSRVSYEEAMGLDVEYVTTQSIWNDTKILLLTIPAVLLTRGAV